MDADLGVLQSDGSDSTKLAPDCITLSKDVASTTSASPAPDPTIEREWQLTLSTSQRVATACAEQKYPRVATDVQPALYTIRDLTHQIGPYLTRQSP